MAKLIVSAKGGGEDGDDSDGGVVMKLVQRMVVRVVVNMLVVSMVV